MLNSKLVQNIKSFAHFKYVGALAMVIFTALAVMPGSALAQTAVEVDDIAENLALSTDSLPGLMTALTYLLGVIFGIAGVLKLKEHTENPSQTPFHVPVTRFLAGGALLALPAIIGAMSELIQDTTASVTAASQINGDEGGLGGIIESMAGSVETLPMLLSFFAYLFGLVFAVAGILKLKEHVENPNQTPLKDGVIRFGVGGALFALPTLISAMEVLINGGGTDPSLQIKDSVDSGNALSEIMGNVVRDFDQIAFLVVNVGGYLLGLLFAAAAVMKLREHVDNPSQVPLKSVIIRFVVGGMLLALPSVYSAVATMFNGGANEAFESKNGVNIAAVFQSGFSQFLGSTMGELNSLMVSMMNGLEGTEDLIKAVAYLLGTFIGFAGVIKLKEHVDSPDQTPLREAVLRLGTAGALFAIPALFQAANDMITGETGGTLGGTVATTQLITELTNSKYTGGNIVQNVVAGAGDIGSASAGNMLSNMMTGAIMAPGFLHAMSYIFALILTLWAVLKIRDHVQNPSQTSVWEGVSRFIAAGAFFALPVTMEAIRATMNGGVSQAMTVAGGISGVQYNEGDYECGGGFMSGMGGLGNLFGGTLNNNTTTSAPGLDTMMGCFMSDIIGPMHTLITFFGYIAGTIFIMIGISRLMKSAQEGARGPGGIGTLMTFVTGGALISFNNMVTTITRSIFGLDELNTKTYHTITYTDGLDDAALGHANTVIASVLKFMIIIGLVSFIRGIFIIRSVAEGNGQASMMSGMTHLIAGAIAINLGAFINAIQTSLGISGLGISFAATSGGGLF